MSCLAKAYECKGDVDATISGLTAILERHPSNKGTWRGVAKAYKHKGDLSARCGQEEGYEDYDND